MHRKILDFLKKERVSCLTTLLPDGSPHAAALHFSHRAAPLTLYFSTTSNSRKCRALLNGKWGKASVVVGFSEKDWLTLQMDGKVKAILNKKELREAKKVHYPKHPESQKYENDRETLFLAFKLSWFRYTDFKTDPPTVISGPI